MQSFRWLIGLVVSLVLVAGCSDDGPTESSRVSIADLTGSWKATSMTFTRKSDGQSFDVIAGGGEYRVTVLSDGRARTWLDFGDLHDEWDAQLSLDGDRLTSTPAESTRATEVATIAMEGGTVTLTDTSAEFDFTLTGAEPVPATLVIVLRPN